MHFYRSLGAKFLGHTLAIFPTRLLQFSADLLLSKLSDRTDRFVMRVERPKTFFPVASGTREGDGYGMAVVLQGPVWTADDFTLLTIQSYRQHLPGALIILSTWEGIPKEFARKVAELGGDVVQSSKPSSPGRLNVNLQAKTSLAGIRYARTKGAVYVVKTRTDQRIYKPRVLPLLAKALARFSVDGDSKQEMRLACLSISTARDSPFFMCDFFMLGKTSDMEDFWNTTYDSKASAFSNSSNDLSSQLEKSPERYLAADFFSRIGAVKTLDVESWHRILTGRLLIIDAAELDLYWAKTNAMVQEWEGVFAKSSSHQAVSAIEWLSKFESRSGSISASEFDGVN